MGFKLNIMLLKFAAKFPVVVDLAIEDDDITSLGIEHRLVAGRSDVYNCKPAKQKSRTFAVRVVEIGPATFIVRTTMELRLVRPGERVPNTRINKSYCTGDAAHVMQYSLT
jgi:hypothetical protein